MKTLISLLAFISCALVIFCDESILSKFHQNGYKLKDVRIQLISYDENVFNFFTIKAFKYNRTTTAHNGSLNLKISIEDKAEALVQAHKFLSNEYRHFPMRFQVNVKKSVDTNALGLGIIRNCGNFTDFYFYKDITYFGCNVVLDERRFPPLIPNGKYRLDMNILYFNKKVALIYTFFEIYIPIEYPKSKN